MSSRPIEPGERVCVTGANGFIASYLIRDLLEAGFRVRGTVRDPSNKAKVQHLLDAAEALGVSEQLELVAADLLEEGSFDDAVTDCAAVVHCAAAVFFAAEDPQRDIVEPSVLGTRNVLEAVRKAGSVRRLVHTSSMVAVYHVDVGPEHVFTEADWNTTSTLDVDPYGLAKVSAEREAVAFVEALPEAERFHLVHLNPGMVWGPPLIKAHAKASPSLVRDVISRAQPGVPQLMLSVVDVRDASRAHVAALTHEDPPSRCLVFSENRWMPEMMQELQAMFPDVKMGTRRIPRFAVLLAALFDKSLNRKQLSMLVGRPLRMDNSLSREAYGMRYRPVSETLRDTAAPMIEKGWARVKR